MLRRCIALFMLWVALMLAVQPVIGGEGKEQLMDTLVLGGGCFWCLDAVYRLVPGVTDVFTGYSGGTMVDPDYKSVCTGETGHAEVVQVTFDPAETGIKQLLDLFWKIHDPTSLNRQGGDVGTQYRSVIFYQGDAQHEAIRRSVAEAQGDFTKPIVTQVAPLDVFYVAEAYHQNYFNSNPDAGYCQMVIAPKVQKARRHLIR